MLTPILFYSTLKYAVFYVNKDPESHSLYADKYVIEFAIPLYNFISAVGIFRVISDMGLRMDSVKDKSRSIYGKGVAMNKPINYWKYAHLHILYVSDLCPDSSNCLSYTVALPEVG